MPQAPSLRLGVESSPQPHSNPYHPEPAFGARNLPAVSLAGISPTLKKDCVILSKPADAGEAKDLSGPSLATYYLQLSAFLAVLLTVGVSAPLTGSSSSSPLPLKTYHLQPITVLLPSSSPPLVTRYSFTLTVPCKGPPLQISLDIDYHF